jgi:RNase P/RNase MRP subunit p29
MRASMVAVIASVVTFAAPAQAGAAHFAGVVVAKQPQRGTLVLARAGGAGLTVHAALGRTSTGDRVEIRGQRLRDGTIRASLTTVVSHTHRALVRGVVVRELRRSTVLTTGRSAITIRHAVRNAHMRAGTPATFRVRIDDDGRLTEEAATVNGAQPGIVEVEGRVVSVSPFVVSVEGLPVTITVPAGMTLPSALGAGDRIEFTVQVAGGNTFTLVAIDEIEDANPPAAAREVEVKGTVVSSTATQLVVRSHGTLFTFAAPAGTTLPVFPVGASVEAKGVSVNGVLTLVRVKVEDDEGGDDDGSHGSH